MWSIAQSYYDFTYTDFSEFDTETFAQPVAHPVQELPASELLLCIENTPLILQELSHHICYFQNITVS